MKLDEIRKTVTTSAAADWETLGHGPTYLTWPMDSSSGDAHWTEHAEPAHLAVYKADVSLRIAWGVEVDDDLKFEGITFPDKAISRFTADAFWKGSLVARWYMLLVDGGRCYLPDVKGSLADTGDGPLDREIVGWTATASDTALAKLLNDLVSRADGEFDSYLKRSGIEVVSR